VSASSARPAASRRVAIAAAADVAAAVVDPLQHRPGQPHEAPQQLEREVGPVLRHLVEDEPPLLVEVPDEGGALLPVDEGAGLPQGGEPLADVGGDRLGAGLGAELEPQPPLGRGVPRGELEQELGEALGAEGLEVVEVEGLLRRCPAATLPGSTLVRNRRCGASIRRLPIPSRPGRPKRDDRARHRITSH
jgi:hypothetical protein